MSPTHGSQNGPPVVISVNGKRGWFKLVLDSTPDYMTDLSAHYAFDETSGATAMDSTPNANNATLYNFPGDGLQ